MPRVKQVEDVAILEWGAGDPPSLVGELRTLVEGGAARRVLLDLTGFDSLRADGLESLTEAFTVCEDRGCQIGLFGTNDTFQRIVELMDLAGDLPPVLGKAEGEAVASLRGRAAGSNGKAAHAPGKAPAAKPPATRPSAAPPTRTVEVELDLGAATAPTAKFDASQVAAVSFGPRAAAPAAPAGAQPDEDLLAIDWAPLVATGYQMGGADAAALVARVGPVSPSAATPAPPAPSTPRARPQEDEGVIDLGEVTPARVPAPRAPGGAAAFRKTEVLPAFVDVDEGSRSGAAAASVLGQRDEGAGDFSPLDAGPSGPPAGVLARGGGASAQLPPPANRPSAERKSERFAPPPRRPGSGPTPAAPTPAAARAAPPAPTYAQPQAPANNAYSQGGGGGYESGDEQTVMFTPGALDAAMLAAAAGDGGVAAPEEAPAPAAPMAEDSAVSDEEETVMFQPGALDAELLAQVAAAVGPAGVVSPPAVEQPPAPAQPAMSDAPDARDLELRLFMHDHALSSPLHLQVLERLARTSDQAFGRSELQLATGAALGVISSVIDQLVAARLLRRTRAPRARGGVGFILSMSPASRNVLARLLKSWQAPASRPRVAAWFEGQ